MSDHHVDKLSIHFSAPKDSVGDVAKLLTAERSEIDKLLDEMFTSNAATSEEVVISKIQLNLGVLPVKDFQQEFKRRLRALLATHLQPFSSYDETQEVEETSSNTRQREWEEWEAMLEYLGVELDKSSSIVKLAMANYLGKSSIPDRMYGLYHVVRLYFSTKRIGFHPGRMIAAINGAVVPGRYLLIQSQVSVMEKLLREDVVWDRWIGEESWKGLLLSDREQSNLLVKDSSLSDEGEEGASLGGSLLTKKSQRDSSKVDSSLTNQSQEDDSQSDSSLTNQLLENSSKIDFSLTNHSQIDSSQNDSLSRDELQENPSPINSSSINTPAKNTTPGIFTSKNLSSTNSSSNIPSLNTPQFNSWNNFQTSMLALLNEPTLVHITLHHLHFLYFAYRQGQKQSSSQPFSFELFRKWLLKQQDPPSTTSAFIANKQEAIVEMLTSGLRNYYSTHAGFELEDMLIFWDDVLTCEKAMVLNVFANHIVEETRWIEMTEILGINHLHRLVAIVSLSNGEVYNDSAFNPSTSIPSTFNTRTYNASTKNEFQKAFSSLFLSKRKPQVKSTPLESIDLVKFYLTSGTFPARSNAVATKKDLQYNVLNQSELKQKILSLTPQQSSEVAALLEIDSEIRNRTTQVLSAPELQLLQQKATSHEVNSPFQYSAADAIETQYTTALAYFYIYKEWPWWFTAAGAELSIGSSLADGVKAHIVKHYLPAFIKLSRSGRENEIATRFLMNIPLPDFLRVVAERFPGTLNIAATSLTLVRDAITDDEIVDKIQRETYYYLLSIPGALTPNDFVQALISIVSKQINIPTDLVERLNSQPVHFDEHHFESYSTLPQEQASTEVSDASRSVDELKEAITSYFRFGTIPLNLSKVFPHGSVLGEYLSGLSHEEVSIRMVILNWLSNRHVLNVLAANGDPHVVSGIIRVLAADRSDEIISWKDQMELFLSTLQKNFDENITLIPATKALLMLLRAGQTSAITLSQYIEIVMRSPVPDAGNISIAALYEKTGEQSQVEGVSSIFIKTLNKVAHFILDKNTHTTRATTARGTNTTAFTTTKTTTNTTTTATILTKKLQPTFPSLDAQTPVHNSGLVILAPFLYSYFDRLQMTEDHRFKTEELALRAVQLLEFLASGQTEMPDKSMVLNKILCGVHPLTPVDPEIELTAEERELSEKLLLGVLQNWEKIKTRSIDALREGFLTRNGYLKETELSWKLDVDRKAQDILVDLIPWSFNMIKLSWMKKSLTTVWQSEQYRSLM